MVLADLRGARIFLRPLALALVLASLEPYQLSQKVSQTNGPFEPREVRQKDVQNVRRTVLASGRCARFAAHRQEFEPGCHG